VATLYALSIRSWTTGERTVMLYLKSCPRCTGDINADSDTHGTFLKCLQCGFSKDLSPEMAARLFGRNTARPVEPIAYPDQHVA